MQKHFDPSKVDKDMILYTILSRYLASCPGFLCFKTVVDVAIIYCLRC
jgi:hypothetical protein